MNRQTNLIEDARAERLAAARAARKPGDVAKNTDGLLQETISSLEPTRAALVSLRASEIPETMLRAYLRAVAGRSVRSAVRAFCSECTCWSREEVRTCTSLACPLYPYRPYQKGKKRGGNDERPTAG
jgi:hypothetical protein